MRKSQRATREPRRVFVLLKLTEAEGALLTARAQAAGLTRTEFARRAALGVRIVSLRVPALHVRAIGQLARLGNNLNQAVHLAHQGRLPASFLATLGEVLALLAALRCELRGELRGEPSTSSRERMP